MKFIELTDVMGLLITSPDKFQKYLSEAQIEKATQKIKSLYEDECICAEPKCFSEEKLQSTIPQELECLKDLVSLVDPISPDIFNKIKTIFKMDDKTAEKFLGPSHKGIKNETLC